MYDKMSNGALGGCACETRPLFLKNVANGVFILETRKHIGIVIPDYTATLKGKSVLGRVAI